MQQAFWPHFLLNAWGKDLIRTPHILTGIIIKPLGYLKWNWDRRCLALWKRLPHSGLSQSASRETNFPIRLADARTSKIEVVGCLRRKLVLSSATKWKGYRGQRGLSRLSRIHFTNSKEQYYAIAVLTSLVKSIRTIFLAHSGAFACIKTKKMLANLKSWI